MLFVHGASSYKAHGITSAEKKQLLLENLVPAEHVPICTSLYVAPSWGSFTVLVAEYGFVKKNNNMFSNHDLYFCGDNTYKLDNIQQIIMSFTKLNTSMFGGATICKVACGYAHIVVLLCTKFTSLILIYL